MKNYKQIVVLILLSSMSSICHGQCDFRTFVNTFFDVYEKSDTLVNLEIYRKGGHKWRLNEADECYNCAIKYFPSPNWCSAIAYHINNCFVLRFWNEIFTDTALVNNTILLLCDEKGKIIDKVILNNTNIEYADVNKYSVWSQYYSLKNTIIWRLYKDTEDGEFTEKQFRIDKNHIVQL